MKYLVFFICLGITIASCSKTTGEQLSYAREGCSGQCYLLTGKVTEQQSGAGIAGVELKFYFKPASYNIITNEQLLGSAITNSEGVYGFFLNSAKFRSPLGYFRIDGSKDGYIFKNPGDARNDELLTFRLDSTMINIPVVNNMAFYKSASFTVQVKATAVTNFMFLTIGYDYGTGGFSSVLTGGKAFNQSFNYKTAANVPTLIQWNATGNGINISRKDTIVVPSGTGKTYQIEL